MRAVFLDTSKAFDRVWHRKEGGGVCVCVWGGGGGGEEVLLHKLNYVNIRGRLLDWFSDYITNRRKSAVLPGSCSHWSYLKAGVTQDSIVGPLLFILFINDIVNDINSNSRLLTDGASLYPASILRKSTSGRHRPVSYPDGPMTARYRFT